MYTKIISYGNTVEIYEYENDLIRLNGRGRTILSDFDDVSNLQSGGEDTLPTRHSEDTVGKRPDNARRAALAFRRIVASNLGGSSLPVLVTLTYRDNFTDLAGAYKHFSTFTQALRRRLGAQFKYISVPEFQKRGAVHFHALFWGLPEELLLLERKNRTVAKIWSHGFVYLKRTDGAERLSFYLTKYMAKAFLDPRLKNQKCYVASRNINRPLEQAGNFTAESVLPFLNVGDEPVIDRTYPTKWLGEGRYRLYKVKHDQS